MNKDTLYYDGRCPLCRREMAKLAHFSRGAITLLNIHDLDPEPGVPDQDTLLARLHLRTHDGTWLTGIEANIRAWHNTPFRYMWALLALPVIKTVAEIAYEFWLDRRRRNTASGAHEVPCSNANCRPRKRH